MVELTLADGDPLMVNQHTLEAFRPADGGTILYFLSGRRETVQESYDAVAQLFDPEAQQVEGD